MEGKFENIKTSDDESKVPWLRGRMDKRTLNCEMTPEDAGVSQVVLTYKFIRAQSHFISVFVTFNEVLAEFCDKRITTPRPP